MQAITEYMMDFAMDRSASHVARELLNTLAGREISPRKKGGAEGHSEGGSFSKKKKKKKKVDPPFLLPT